MRESSTGTVTAYEDDPVLVASAIVRHLCELLEAATVPLDVRMLHDTLLDYADGTGDSSFARAVLDRAHA